MDVIVFILVVSVAGYLLYKKVPKFAAVVDSVIAGAKRKAD